VSGLIAVQPSSIGNKLKRQSMWLKVKAAKEDLRSKERKQRRKEIAEGLPVSKPVQAQKTLDNTREADPTMVQADDEEFVADEAQDEFASYFRGDVEPKIIITSCYHPSKVMYEFIRDLLYVFPNSFYYKRMNYTVAQISEAAKKRGYTDLLIVNEDRKQFNALTHVHLPDGPTAYYKLSNVTLCKDIEGHGRTTSHQPEVILNNFVTRLGARVGRMLGALLHQQPDFKGRRVVTFHNQRDFIFFRHHRYVFDKDEKTGELGKARLQQLGPKFTLKLRWLQHGIFDPSHGELEWTQKKENDTSRRKFNL